MNWYYSIATRPSLYQISKSNHLVANHIIYHILFHILNSFYTTSTYFQISGLEQSMLMNLHVHTRLFIQHQRQSLSILFARQCEKYFQICKMTRQQFPAAIWVEGWLARHTKTTKNLVLSNKFNKKCPIFWYLLPSKQLSHLNSICLQYSFHIFSLVMSDHCTAKNFIGLKEKVKWLVLTWNYTRNINDNSSDIILNSNVPLNFEIY